MRFTWILTIVGCLFCLHTCDAKLRLIQAVFRHGNRTPMPGAPIYPNDPHYNNTYLPDGPGSLTVTGKQAVFRLGEFFRDRYGKFLGPIYSNRIIRFRADEVDRIVMTGQLVAAALFPPETTQRWNPSLNWQPIPVWTTSLESDVLYNGQFCSKYKQMRIDLDRTDTYLQRTYRENKEFFDYVSKHAGANMTQYRSFFFRQQLFAERDVGLKLPEWLSPIFPDGKLDKIATYDLLVQSYTNEMRQLLAGVWIQEWLNNVNKHLQNSSKNKLKAYMYAAHEINIAPILIALNCFDYRIPSYASTIVHELHEIDEELYVRLVHKDGDTVRYLDIPGCGGEMCPLSVFEDITAHLIPENPIKQCGDIKLETP